MNLEALTPGEQYTFQTKDLHVPGETIPGERKVRAFVGMEDRGAAGLPKKPFVEVERDNGTRHLIAVETILSVEPV